MNPESFAPQHFGWEFADGIAVITLNRPERKNPLTFDSYAELRDTFRALVGVDTVRVVVLTGAGKSFCAGGDLAWMQAQREAEPEARVAESMKLATMLYALNQLPKPLIGAVQGNAFGGGLGLMSVCDVAVGVETAKFGFTETRLGLIPANIGPYVVARMGEARVRRVFMSSRIFDAQEAIALGLLARAVPADDLASAVEAEVVPYLNCAPGAVAASKKLVQFLGPQVDDAVMDYTATELGKRWDSEEGAEGIAAFFDKRKANWVP